MANLIIKSSADNLVLQGSDASPAITVGATGTTTFAENATFSGTANVYGAGTFPDGMIIQTKAKQDDADSHAYLTSTSGWVSHGLESSIKFTFTPKSATSTILLEYNHGTVHTSTGGGWGYQAFTKDGDRDGWGGGLAGYNDTSGHFRTGWSGASGMYHTAYGRLWYQNDSTSAFELGMDVKWGAGAWYYAHSDAFLSLSATEYAGSISSGNV